jgi:hypothetical protein
MRDLRSLGLCGLLAAFMLVSIAPLSASAATPVRFGAKLTHATQPNMVDRCKDYGHPSTAKCTWVAVEAFENGGHERAPKPGTIHKVRLMSCVGGSFTVQVARAKPSQDKARIVRSGPTINYVRDPRSHCGGVDEDDYIIQTFNVSFHVDEGDYIAVKGTKVGFMHGSSSGDALVFYPTLPTGGSTFQIADDQANALLIQFQY